MRISQVSTRDIKGGAERVAWNLFKGYQTQGHESFLYVGEKYSDDPAVYELPNQIEREKNIWTKIWLQTANNIPPHIKGGTRLIRTAKAISEPHRWIDRQMGYENFHFPGTDDLSLLQTDIIHAHNLHGNYFDLRQLPFLSQKYPFVMTLHDAWLLSGHCAHSFDCDRWHPTIGCGQCPDLEIYPRLLRDGTAYNWKRKASIYERSHLYVSTPCQWLMNKVEQSMLMRGIKKTKIIPYGVDLSVFKAIASQDKQAVRDRLGLPSDAYFLLFSAASIRESMFKDYQTMRAALQIVAQHTKERQKRVIFVALGEDAPSEKLSEHVEIWFMPFEHDLDMIAAYYQVADLYLHAAKADTFPNAILEALACGTPVIASAVGGIPEQVKNLGIANQFPKFDSYTADQATGILVSAGDSYEMGQSILYLLEEDALRQTLSQNAAKDAKNRFDLNEQIKTHLVWYQEILNEHHPK